MSIISILQYAGVICWVLYLILAVKQNIACWLFGIIASCITVILFYHTKIYSEAILNIYYIIAGIYGWLHWSKAPRNEKMPIVKWQMQKHIQAIGLGLLIWIILGTVLKRFTDSPRPFVDALTATFSFIATYMETKKILTCWIFWIIINSILIGLQIDRHLYLYAGLSAFFIVMGFKGFLDWKKAYALQQKVIN